MELVIDSGEFRLEQVEDFKAFSVRASERCRSPDVLSRELGHLGYVDGEHVWLHAKALGPLAPRNTEWQARFQAMLNAVIKYGFYDPEKDVIRAHVTFEL